MIRVEQVAGGVTIVRLDRPERRNALGTELARLLLAALHDADADEAVRVILLTGSPPAFCAGSDLKELAAVSTDGMRAHEMETAAVVRAITTLRKPVIAAIEGYAFGGGFMLAIACDIVVTGRGANWQLLETPNGWLPIWGMRALMSRAGPVRARLLSWGAERIDGAEARRLGIADYLADDGAVEARAMELARDLAGLPPEAVVSVKAYFRPFATVDAERLDELAGEAFARDSRSDAAQLTFRKYSAP